MENQNTHYVLAFDFGASSGRAILGALKDGKIEMKEIRRCYRKRNDVLGYTPAVL